LQHSTIAKSAEKLKQLPKATFQLKMLYILDESIFDQFFSWSCLERMNAQRFAVHWPTWLVVVLLVLTGCTTIRTATVDSDPVATPTLSVSLLPTAPPTAALSAIPAQVNPGATLLPTLSPVTSTPVPVAKPGPLPGSTRLPDVPIERRLLVSQDEQMMLVYENNLVVRTIPVSTGAPVTSTFTPPWQGFVGDDWGRGPFRNRQLADYKWYLFPGPEGSILIHSVPYTITNGIKVYDRPEALGQEPVSNGCVRISPEDAAWLKGWDPVGVSITITRWSGKIQPADTIDQETTAEEKNE